jgi:hypothetical protein
MSTRASTVYKYVKERCLISKEHCDAREHRLRTPILQSVPYDTLPNISGVLRYRNETGSRSSHV